jgi:carboxypeptidase Q
MTLFDRSWKTRSSCSMLALVLFAGAPVFAGDPVSTYTAVIDGKETPAPIIEMGDEEIVRAILDEGKNRNQVMEHLKHFTQNIGPRLTGSTRAKQANDWCVEKYREWGLSEPRLEEWGKIPVGFDRGPSSGSVLLRRETRSEDEGVKVEFEEIRQLEFTTPAWTRGTQGPVSARVVKQPSSEVDFDKVREQLKDAWVLIPATSPVAQRGIRERVSSRIRMREEAHKKSAEATEKGETPELSLEERIATCGAAGFISASRDERVWTGPWTGWREMTIDTAPRDIEVVVRRSDYDFINSRVFDNEPIEVSFDLSHRLFTTEGGVPVYNTIAEIRGTEKPDEYIIVSAHLDSWDGPGSQGCTDNGTGSAVTLEAARILMAVGAKPKRTILFINWTGEEQGLLGSAAWIKLHQDKLDKISAVFVDDGGTNYEGGLPAPDNMVDLLAAATAPINNQFYSEADGKFLNVNVRPVGKKITRGGGSDHASFTRLGIPGFFWDEVGRADYGYGWHTQNDKFDLAIPEYLMQSATNAAMTAYRLACAETMLPREAPEEEDKADAEPAKPEEKKEGAAAPTGGNG